MVRTFLNVYMGICSYFVYTRTNKRHHHLTLPESKKLTEEGGYTIDNPLKLVAQLHTAVVKLVQILPVKSVIQVAGIKDVTIHICRSGDTDL
jgi:hypothetical protein